MEKRKKKLIQFIAPIMARKNEILACINISIRRSQKKKADAFMVAIKY